MWPWLLKVNFSFKNNYLTCFSISHLMVKILKQLLQIKFGFIKNQLANQIHRFKKMSEKCKSREMETGKRSTTFNSLQFATFINVLIYIFIWKKEWKLVTSDLPLRLPKVTTYACILIILDVCQVYILTKYMCLAEYPEN